MPTIDFILNDRETSVACDPDQNLLEVLREQCGIRSIKDGCSPEGICGCCTIMLDGKPVLACRTKPEKITGRNVRTLEGLGDTERKLLARAFAEEQAVQCGFCTPGILMRSHHLLEQDPDPDQRRVQQALKGHLCRCTGYKSIERAVHKAAELRRNAELEPAEDKGSGIGADLPRYQASELALGDRPFVADLTEPGMLHAVLVFAEHPRARLTRLATRAAKEMPGVVDVFCWDSVPGSRKHGLLVQDWPLLIKPGECSRYMGDVLAIVVAESRQKARRAAAKVEAEWEVLPVLSDPLLALDAHSPMIHDSGNLLESCAFARGDVDASFEEAAHVIQAEFATQRIEHAFLEPEACLAKPTADGLHICTQGQGVHDDARQIAAILGLRQEQVMVELVPNGGAFGGKEDLSVQGHAALAAWLLKRPVRIALSRAESLRLHPKRHPIQMNYKVAVDANGKLLAARIRMTGDTGAYASVGAKVLERAAGHSCGPYHVPSVDVRADAVYTNNPPCGAMRGFGVNQAAFAIENILDEAASLLELDRWEIRKRNILREGLRFATGQVMSGSVRGLERCLDAVKDEYESADCVGLALGIKNTGIGNGVTDTGRVRLRVLEGGRLQVHTGYTEMGQGLFTILRQVVQEETGLPVECMEVGTNSELALLCGMTTASRATALAGAAGGDAARKLAADLQETSLEELKGREYHGEFHCNITTSPGDTTKEPVTHMAFSYAAQLVKLDENGRITEVLAAHDVGRAINPASCVGQIEGSLHMGLGYALSEDFPCTDGHPNSLKLKDVGVLRAHETPPLRVILIEEPDPIGGYGVKGVGEIGLVPTAAAVACALRAKDGKVRSRLPMTEDRSMCLAPAGRPGV